MTECFLQLPAYEPNSRAATHLIDGAIVFAQQQQQRIAERELQEGVHAFGRRRQMVLKSWVQMVESLVHERSPWGELQEATG